MSLIVQPETPFLTLLLFCALADVSTRKIPHYFLYLGFLLCAMNHYKTAGLPLLFHCLLASLCILAAGFPLFQRRLFGAGDVKLLALMAFYTGFGGLVPFLFRIFLVGSFCGLAKWLITLKQKETPGRQTIPFAVPVFFGFLFNLLCC